MGFRVVLHPNPLCIFALLPARPEARRGIASSIEHLYISCLLERPIAFQARSPGLPGNPRRASGRAGLLAGPSRRASGRAGSRRALADSRRASGRGWPSRRALADSHRASRRASGRAGFLAGPPCNLAVHSRRASGRAGSRRAFSPCFRLGWISPGLGKFSGRFSPCLLAVLQGGLAFSPCLPGVSPGLLALLQGGPDLPGHLLNSCRAFLHPFRASMWASSCPACSRRAQNSRRAFSPCFRVGSSCRRLARILPQEGTRSSIWLTSLVDLPLDPVCKSTIGPSKVGQDILHHV